MSKIQFAIMATLILSIGMLALAPTAKAQRYGGTSERSRTAASEAAERRGEERAR
jgi:hypothetical protein